MEQREPDFYADDRRRMTYNRHRLSFALGLGVVVLALFPPFPAAVRAGLFVVGASLWVVSGGLAIQARRHMFGAAYQRTNMWGMGRTVPVDGRLGAVIAAVVLSVLAAGLLFVAYVLAVGS